ARVGFLLPREAHVRIRLLDVMGRSVATLADGVFPAGRNEVSWNRTVREGSAAAAGVCFVSCETGGRTFVRRAAMIRQEPVRVRARHENPTSTDAPESTILSPCRGFDSPRVHHSRSRLEATQPDQA